MSEFRNAPKRDLGNGNSDARTWPTLQPRNARGRFAPGGTGLVKGSSFDRFIAKVRPVRGGCWYWTGAKDHGGYATFLVVKGKWQAGHRFAYEQFIGSIPAGLTLDHLCRNRACVNPLHLEPVTLQINVNRSPISRKVSDEIAAEILALRPPSGQRSRPGTGLGVIADRFGTSKSTVLRIWKGGVSYVRIA